ncbi:MAG: hypothetical protein J6T30_07640, partial [Bacteroidales bacterium]|nr:hypothetical protein [Bacteroidales bacterium]
IYNRTNPSSHFTISTTTPFTIPSTAALEINYTSNNNRNVLIAHATRNDNDLYLNGRLIVRSGSLYVGQASAPNYNNDIVYSGSVGSYIEVTGGELIVNGQIRRDASTINGALTYVQTGGDVRINGNNQLATKAKLEVLNTGSVFNMSGGTLTIVNGGGTEYGDLYLRPASSNVTGGTILFGYNNNNARTYTLEANIPLYNVVIQGSNSTVNIMTSPLDINGDLTINAGDVLNANGKDVSIAGNLLNNGTYNFGNNKTTFDGNVQSITGTSTTNFNKLHVASLSSLTVDRSFNVADSLIINSTATLILGNNGVTLQGNMINDGAYSDNNVAGSGVIFNSTENQSVSGANGHFDRFEINKPSGILTAESDISILNDLVMTNGVFDIESNRLYLNQTSSIVENNPFGIGNMISVNGVSSSLGVRKYFGTGASTFTYPIGVSGKYTPVVFNISQNTSPGYINVIPVNSYQPSVDIPEQVLDYYWTIDNGGMTVDATANFYYSDEDVRGDEASYLAARVIPQTSVWYQSDDLNSVDETNNIIYFSFTNSTSNLNGDYTAGTDPAIYNFVPRYQTNSDGVWSDPTIWTPLDGSGPCPDGGPFGADVIIDHYVTITTDNIFANSVTINDTLRIDPSTSGHNFTQVIGDGALYLENGNMPAGDYSTFVDCSGNGTIIYGGSGSYQIVADLYNRIPNLVFYGTGTRIMPNVDLYICNRFIIDGPTVDNSVNNRDLYILGSMERYNTGAYVAGNGTVVFAGSQVQTLGGTTGNFSGSDKFYNLKVSNPNGLRIGDNGFIEVGNMLYLDEGIIYTSSTNQLYLSSVSPNAVYPEGGSTSSYVSGPLTKRIANGSSFLYPLGKGSDKSHAFVVTSAAGTSVVLDWTAEYFTPNTYLSPFISPIEGINMEEYWTLMASDAASATVYISYDNTSGLTPPMITGGIADMCVAEYVSGWRQLASTVTLESNMEEGEVQMTRTTTVSQTPKPFTTASVSATLPRAALRPAAGGDFVCGTEEGIPVSFSSSSIVIGFPITLTYMVDGVEHTDVITSAPLEWSIATPVPGSYWLTGFTYSGGLPGVVDGTVVTVYDNSSILANAGLDQEMCGGYQTVLDANIPPPGATGRWTIILGSGGQFIGSYGNADPHAAFKGLSGETYVLRWTVSNGFCSSYDDVQISF